MKVILLQNVKNLGKKDQVIDVADGYAMNFLFPKKLAVKVSEHALDVQSKEQKKVQQDLDKKRQEALELKKKLELIFLVIKIKSGKDGKMFGSVTTKQVCEELSKLHSIELDKRKFIDTETINHFGTTILKIELFKDVIGEVNVKVVEEK
jgi:large subunit ribosomal protein L9